MTSPPVPKDDILAVLAPSPARRWSGIITIILLGFILLWVAAVPQPAVVWQVVFLIAALGCFWSAHKMYQATSEWIYLTRDEILSGSGEVLARVENVSQVERGAFAFKPSQGFLVRLKKSEGSGAWRPGLWWRRGTFLGIGGVVPGGQSRAMAEILTALMLGVLPENETKKKKKKR